MLNELLSYRQAIARCKACLTNMQTATRLLCLWHVDQQQLVLMTLLLAHCSPQGSAGSYRPTSVRSKQVCLQIDSIRAALEAFGPCGANLRKGRCNCQLSVSDVLASPKFSPDGRQIALVQYIGEGADSEASELEYDRGGNELEWSFAVIAEGTHVPAIACLVVV